MIFDWMFYQSFGNIKVSESCLNSGRQLMVTFSICLGSWRIYLSLTIDSGSYSCSKFDQLLTYFHCQNNQLIRNTDKLLGNY